MIRRLLDIDAPESTACDSDLVVARSGDRLIFGRGPRGARVVVAEVVTSGAREMLLLAARIANAADDKRDE